MDFQSVGGLEGVTGMMDLAMVDRLNEGDLDIRLEEIGRIKEKVVELDRNPFRFSQSTVPFHYKEGVVERTQAEGGEALLPQDPEEAAADTSWSLRFIGVVGSTGTGGLIAVVSTAYGVFHGREGDIVAGRYRITKLERDLVDVLNLAEGDRRRLRLVGN